MRNLSIVSFALTLTACISDNPATTRGGGDAMPDMDVVDAQADGHVDGAPPDCELGIEVSPPRVDFPQIAAFDTRTETVVIRNTGDCPWTIDRLTQNGDRVFRMRVGGVDVQRDFAALADPDGDGTPGLSPGADFEADFEFTPSADEPFAASFILRIGSADIVVELTGNQSGRCLVPEPSVLEFTTTVNSARTGVVELRNCGTEAISLGGLSLEGPGAEAFELAEPNVNARIEPAAAESIRVRFQPNREGAFNAALRVTAEGIADQVVQLVGRAQTNACPVAVVPAEVVRAEIGEAVVLNGDQSRDPDGPEGRPVEWAWTVVEMPAGAGFVPVESLFDDANPADGGPADDPETPTAIFVPPAPGRYVLQLSVTDAEGLSSRDCDSDALVVIEVGAPGRMVVQLTWEAPGDLNPDDDEGVDIDLAVSRGDFVCTPAEPTPDWPPEGPQNDPVYAADDRAMGGPESILFADVLPGEPFIIRAIYDDGVEFGPAAATVRVFVNDELRAEETRPLSIPGDQFQFEFEL